MTNELAATAGVQGLLCPVCKVNLVMTSREGVEIDYCPTCRGVWLDRGELDKIIERNIAAGGAQTGAAPMDQQPDPRNAPPRATTRIATMTVAMAVRAAVMAAVTAAAAVTASSRATARSCANSSTDGRGGRTDEQLPRSGQPPRSLWR